MYNSLNKALKDQIEVVIGLEGIYSDNPLDAGGLTKYGITEAVARKHNYTGHMKDLPISKARDIYATDYIVKPKYDQVYYIAGAELASELIESGINCGTYRATKWLQRSINALTKPPENLLVEDGAIGSLTLEALTNLIYKRGFGGNIALTKMCNSMQCLHYVELAEGYAANKEFIYGWITNRI